MKRLPILAGFLLLLLISCQPDHSTVTLALLGDINLGRGVRPSADSLAFLAPELATADLALANLESPLAPGDGYALPGEEYNLCAPAGRAALLTEWGLDLFSLANNHTDDCTLSGASGGAENTLSEAGSGDEGLLQTRSALADAGLAAITAQPLVLEVNGLRLAFLAFEDVSSPLDGESAAQAIRSAHAAGAVVIVSLHWGMEYQGGASERQESLSRQFAEAGAALIWGHHPHVLQRAEWIGPSTAASASSVRWLRTCPERRSERSDDRSRRTLVLYSLGNALFDQGALADTRQSALVVVTLDSRGVAGARVVPFVIDVTRSRVGEADSQIAKKIHQSLSIP